MSRRLSPLWTFLYSLFLSVNLICEASQSPKIHQVDYIFCVDGGGSSTKLKVLDQTGNEVAIVDQRGVDHAHVTSKSSNITTHGKDFVLESFNDLFENKFLKCSGKSLKEVTKASSFVGGFAGVARDETKKEMLSIIESLGFQPDSVSIYSDAELAMNLIDESGAILIAGTGSISFVREGELTHRIGGLGHRISDNGSGYDIGLKGIRAAIESEYENFETSLLEPIKNHFQIESPKNLIGPINRNELSPQEIAAVCPIVFEEAKQGDQVAKVIVQEGADELAKHLVRGIGKTELNHPTTYLIGGLFQSDYSEEFIQRIAASKCFESLSSDKKPLLVNISNLHAPSSYVKKLIWQKKSSYHALAESLPICDQVLTGEFLNKYRMGFLSTEKSNQGGSELSALFHKNPISGLQALHNLDQSVFEGASQFIEENLDHLSLALQDCLDQNGRIFLVGSGSSGRIALDLASKWREYHQKNNISYQDSVIGVIAGGARAFVKAKEGFEDSVQAGYEALDNYNFNSSDIAILISASGSASFNVGAAKCAYDKGGSCYYFYNSQKVPTRTQELFDQNIVRPILVDIGPQSITGSTRLQAASLAELCLGSALDCLIKEPSQIQLTSMERARQLLDRAFDAHISMQDHYFDLLKIIDLEVNALSSNESNFFRATDESTSGYITFLANNSSIREVMVDATETAPTFSTNPPRSIYKDQGLKKAEFRAFLASVDDNLEAWQSMINQPLSDLEKDQVSDLILSKSETGYGSYNLRTQSSANLVIGTFKSDEDSKQIEHLIENLDSASLKGLKTACIVVGDKKGLPDSILKKMNSFDAQLYLHTADCDPLGILPTLSLKQALNLLSNSTMILMNKVYGNTMIDVSLANNKLIDRAIRIIDQIYSQKHPGSDKLDYELLFQFVTRANQYKKLMESQLKVHVPSCVKLVLTMIEKNCDAQTAQEILKVNKESIHEIYSS